MNKGEEIAKKRSSKGWTQQKLAEESGLSLRTIQRIENNQGTPQLHTLARLQDILEISSLFEDEENESELNYRVITLMSVSSLLVIVPVIGNLILPLVILLSMSKAKKTRRIGGAFLVVQTLWSILLVIVGFAALNVTILIWGETNPGKFSPVTMTFILFWTINLALLTMVVLQAKSGKNRFLHRFPSVF